MYVRVSKEVSVGKRGDYMYVRLAGDSIWFGSTHEISHVPFFPGTCTSSSHPYTSFP